MNSPDTPENATHKGGENDPEEKASLEEDIYGKGTRGRRAFCVA
jgi:hypothetical protein